jgi:hypothetical protein
MDIFLLNCNWLLSKYFQCIVLLFNLKFLLSLSLGLILSFNFKTLIVFICNFYLDILQFGRLQTKCLIIFIIKHFMVLVSRNYLTLWFLLHNLRFILLYKHKWRLIKCLFFHDWLVLIYQNLLLKLIFLDLIWEIIICKCHIFKSILIINISFLSYLKYFTGIEVIFFWHWILCIKYLLSWKRIITFLQIKLEVIISCRI